MIKIKAIGDHVLVNVIPAEETVQNGLIVPGSAQNYQSHGIVAAVGPEVTQIKEGDDVVFPPTPIIKNKKVPGYDPTHTIGNGEYIAMREKSIIAVIGEDGVVEKKVGDDEVLPSERFNGGVTDTKEINA